MTELSIRERVALGVELLDEKEPGWWRRIDLETLDLGNCEKCVGGQLVGEFTDAVHEWFAGGFVTASGHGMSHAVIFDADYPAYVGAVNAEYDALTAEWRRVIEERRAADGEQVDVVVLG